MSSDGFVRRPRPADYYLGIPLSQFCALREIFELIEERLPDLVKQRGLPAWDGDPATSGQTVKAQLYQGMVDSMMPQAYRGAILVALWGLFESTLIVAGDSIRRLDPGMAPLPTGNRWLRQMKRYFRNEVGFPLYPPGSPSVERELNALQKIRHVFSHANGMKQATKKRDWESLEEYARDNPGVGLGRNYLEVSADFVRSRFAIVAKAITHVTERGRDKLDELGVTDEGLPGEAPPPGKMPRRKRWFRSLTRSLGFRKWTRGQSN